MLRSTEILIAAGLLNKVFTKYDVHRIFAGSPARQYGLINKALKKKEWIQLKKGVYILALKYQPQKMSEFSIACHMVPHSYVSFESALSYHGWIPERVTMVSSVLHEGRTKMFETPLGDYSYTYIPTNEYEFLSAVIRENINEQPFLVAKPLRALADLVYDRKLVWQGIAFLTESLRIDFDNLLSLNKNDFVEIQDVYRNKRVNHFISQLKIVLHHE